MIYKSRYCIELQMIVFDCSFIRLDSAEAKEAASKNLGKLMDNVSFCT